MKARTRNVSAPGQRHCWFGSDDGPQQAGRARAADRVLADAGDQVRAGVGACDVKPVEARPAEHDTEQFAVAGRIPAAQGYLP